MSIKKYSVALTAWLHLNDGDGNPMFADGPDGKPDPKKPMRVELYSPGSKQYGAANAAQNNRLIDKMKAKGKSRQTEAEQAKEKADFLADVTKSFENIEYEEGLEGKELFKAVYADREIGFVADQVNEYLGDWANFTKASPTP